MKKIVYFLLLISSFAFSQDFSEKWNTIYQRYDYVDNKGNLIGYKKWNSVYQRWDYTQINSNNQVKRPVEVEPPIERGGDLKLAIYVLQELNNKYPNGYPNSKMSIQKSNLMQFNDFVFDNNLDKMDKKLNKKISEQIKQSEKISEKILNNNYSVNNNSITNYKDGWYKFYFKKNDLYFESYFYIENQNIKYRVSELENFKYEIVYKNGEFLQVNKDKIEIPIKIYFSSDKEVKAPDIVEYTIVTFKTTLYDMQERLFVYVTDEKMDIFNIQRLNERDSNNSEDCFSTNKDKTIKFLLDKEKKYYYYIICFSKNMFQRGKYWKGEINSNRLTNDCLIYNIN